MTQWWAGIPPAETSIRCGEAHHRLRWADGTLQLLGHGDVAGERTLAALAQQRNACVETADRWHRHARNPRVLVLASRGATDPLGVGEDDTGAFAHGGLVAVSSLTLTLAGGQGVPGAPQVDEDEDLVELLRLGGGLGERLSASVIAHWADQLERDAVDAGTRAILEAALLGRLTAALRAWLGEPQLGVALEMTEHGSAPTLSRQGPTVRAAFPFSWLRDVWARQLAAPFGRLCLSATTPDGGETWTLTTVAQDLASEASLNIEVRRR